MSPSTETHGSHPRQPAEPIADRTIRAAAVDIDGTGVRSNKPVIEPPIIDKLALTIPVTEHTAQARLIGRIRARAICEPIHGAEAARCPPTPCPSCGAAHE